MPEWAAPVRERLAGLRLTGEREAEIVEEITQHLDQRYDELCAAGAPHAEAYRAALEELRDPALLRSLGALRQTKTPAPIAPGAPRGRLVDDLRQDLRHGWRTLRKQPGFTAAAMVTLALGIGASTAIFSLIDAALLRRLPFPDPDRLVVIWAENARTRTQAFPYFPPANADVSTLRAGTAAFVNVAAVSPRRVDLAAGAGEAERVGAAGVTAGFFETLGVTPILGRPLAPQEEVFGGPPVALIGHGLWQRRFGGDPAIVGKPISINGGASTIVGVLPPGFDFPRGAEWPTAFPFSGRSEIWLPIAFRPTDDGTGWSNWQSRHERGLVVLGRVKPEATVAQAQAEMTAFAAHEAREHPETHKDTTLTLVPLREQMSRGSSTALLILLAAVALLQLIACVNVANLLLARGVAREQEFAVRTALGARRGRLIRQLLAEGLLLSALACGMGMALAAAGLKAFLYFNPVEHTRLDDAALDFRAFAFAAGLTMVTSLMFGLVPALRSAGVDLRGSLRDGARASEGAGRDRLRAGLVAAEVGLAVVLLAAAGLTVRSFLQVLAVHPGFRPDSVLVFELQGGGSRYANEAGQIALYRDVTTRLQSLAGVEAAGAISFLPLGGGQNMGSFTIEGAPPPQPGRQDSAERRLITTGYFAAMGIPLRRGRGFTADDTLAHPRVVVINDTLARRFFPASDPLGQRLRVGGAWRTIVGIVPDVRSSSIEGAVNPQIYLPHAQWSWGGMSVVVHTRGDPLALVPAVRSALTAIDPRLAAANVRSMEQVVSRASRARRFTMLLLAFFALTALLLTAVGIYGVVSFLVGRRRHEIGVRLALGAQRADIVRLVLRQGMTPVVLGAVVGLPASIAGTRLVASQLYGVSVTDPLTFASILALLAAAALLACWLPARRAMRVAPLEALRTE